MTFKGESTMVSRFLGLGTLTVALVLGGCTGDEDDDGATTAPTTTPMTTDTDPTGTTMEETGDPDDTGDDTTEPTVRFSELEGLFQTRCVDGCHEPGGLWATFDMTGDLYGKLVGVTSPVQGTQCNLVEAGDAERSYLWHKIAGTHTQNCGGSGMQMPVTMDLSMTDPLPQADLDRILEWIEGGAAQ